MADLDASPGLVMRLNSVVSIWVDAKGATQAELRQVQAAGKASFSAAPVPGSRFTRA